MIFTAMLLICEINMPKTFDTCIVFTSEYQYKTEEECTSSIVELLNNELFRYIYTDYSVEEYACHTWLHIEV
jgi:hypothetical protein